MLLVARQRLLGTPLLAIRWEIEEEVRAEDIIGIGELWEGGGCVAAEVWRTASEWTTGEGGREWASECIPRIQREIKTLIKRSWEQERHGVGERNTGTERERVFVTVNSPPFSLSPSIYLSLSLSYTPPPPPPRADGARTPLAIPLSSNHKTFQLTSLHRYLPLAGPTTQTSPRDLSEWLQSTVEFVFFLLSSAEHFPIYELHGDDFYSQLSELGPLSVFMRARLRQAESAVSQCASPFWAVRGGRGLDEINKANPLTLSSNPLPCDILHAPVFVCPSLLSLDEKRPFLRKVECALKRWECFALGAEEARVVKHTHLSERSECACVFLALSPVLFLWREWRLAFTMLCNHIL